MDRDFRTERVPGLDPLQHFGPDHQGRHGAAHAYRAAQPPPPNRTPHDVCSVLGLPPSSMSPPVMDAVTRLLAEIDRLHVQDEQSGHRQGWLEHQADTHSLLPCLNRRAFLRLLQSYLSGPDATGILLTIQVDGVETLGHRAGLPAADAALFHIHGRVGAVLRGTDLLACLGGSHFAALLPGANLSHGRAKLADMIASITYPSFVWRSQPVELPPCGGIHVLDPGELADVALDYAETNRLGRGA